MANFSKSLPQLACQSSKDLLRCAQPAIGEKCGAKAQQFAREYVEKFAIAIDRRCRLDESAKEENGEGVESKGNSKEGEESREEDANRYVG